MSTKKKEIPKPEQDAVGVFIRTRDVHKFGVPDSLCRVMAETGVPEKPWMAWSEDGSVFGITDADVRNYRVPEEEQKNLEFRYNNGQTSFPVWKGKAAYPEQSTCLPTPPREKFTAK